MTTLQLEGDTDYHDLLLTLNQVIYLKQGKDSNDSLGPSRLVPSFYDREPYYSLIASDSLHESPSDQVSYQLQAKKCFNSKIKEEVARIKVKTYKISLINIDYFAFVESQRCEGSGEV